MIEKFEVGKIYKLNTVLSTDKEMLKPGCIVAVLEVEKRKMSRWNIIIERSIPDTQTRITMFFDNKIIHAMDWGDRLLDYFNEIKE